MKPAEEDALVRGCEPFGGFQPKIEEAIRLAIRAAVAHERERCARVCEEMNGSPWHTPTARRLAAAIRRGE